MLFYTIKRTALALLTVFMIATITFFLMFLVPGGPFLSEKAISPSVKAAMEAKYGLDKPVIEQYVIYIGNIARGDFGVSLKKIGRTVNQIITEKFPVSARIGLISVFVALLIGVPMGALAALNRGKWLDNLLLFFATIGISMPGFIVATIMLLVFGMNLKILPTIGLSTPLHYIMPVATLSFYPLSYMARLMRSSMLDVLGQDYIRTAKSKGVSGFMILFKHALKNAVIPIITYLGPLLAYTLTGSLVVEKIFTIPGLGGEYISSIINRDYPMIMGTTIFLSVILVFMNVVVDLLYKVVDKRIKLK